MILAWLPLLVDIRKFLDPDFEVRSIEFEIVSVPLVPISIVVLSPENTKSKMVGLLLGYIFTLLLTIRLSMTPSFCEEIW